MRIHASSLGTLLLVSSLTSMLASPPARAWSVGTDLSVAEIIPKSGDGATSIQIGSGPGLFLPLLQPGLRVAVTPNGSAHEVVFGAGLSVLSGDSQTSHQAQLLAAYQYNFPSRSHANFFVTAGPGLVSLGYEGETFSGFTFGGGGGVRLHFAEGHGATRFELRFDHQGDMKHDGVTVIESFEVVALKVGFELWD